MLIFSAVPWPGYSGFPGQNTLGRTIHNGGQWKISFNGSKTIKASWLIIHLGGELWIWIFGCWTIRDCAISYRLVTLSHFSPYFSFFFSLSYLQGLRRPCHFPLSAVYRQFDLAHSPAVNRPWIVIVMVSSLEVPNPTGTLLPFASYNSLQFILHRKNCLHFKNVNLIFNLKTLFYISVFARGGSVLLKLRKAPQTRLKRVLNKITYLSLALASTLCLQCTGKGALNCY